MPLHFAGDVGSDLSNPVAVTSTTTTNLDMSTGNYFRIALGSTITTLAITNPPPTAASCRLKLAIIQDATGSRAITNWPSNMRFTGSANPTLTTTAAKADYFSFVWDPTALLWFEDNRDLAVANA
jgi:hypothetical protein